MKTRDTKDPSSRASVGTVVLSLWIYLFWIVLVILSLWGFTADDSFIVYRYAENLAFGNGLTYNADEFISALTSPLHAFICALLTLAPCSLIVSNKLLAILALAGSLGWACLRLNYGPFRSSLVIGIVVSSPLVLFWTVGGLETAYLLALLVILYVQFDRFRDDPSGWTGLWLSITVGCCFLTRFDSILLVGPVLVHSAFRLYHYRGLTTIGFIGLLFPAALLAGSWMTFSLFYYHDIFPTSYYSKGLLFSWYGVAINSLYILQFLILSGMPIVLFVLLVRIRLQRVSTRKDVALAWGRRHTGILVGLLLSLLYATGMVTTHMMFSYRFLIPFLPILLFLALDLWRDLPSPAESPFGRPFATATLSILAFHGILLFSLLTTSLNIGVVGEYRAVNLGEYKEFTRLLEQQATCIRDHWSQQDSSTDRPVVYVYAAGTPGYFMPKFKIVDSSIISYRHYFRGGSSGVSRSADYLFVTSRHGRVDRQLGGGLTGLQRLPTADRSIQFDGRVEHFAVYFNPTPIDLVLPSYVDGAAPSTSKDNSMQ